MRQILRTERRGDGVDVIWEKAGKEITSYFTFTQLIGMQVNALDILNTPSNYGLDEKTEKIAFVAYCQPSRHQE